MNAVRHRGFVMMMAVILLMLVGVALAAMTALLRHESRRTSAAGDDAQLRQVLIAAEAWPARQLAAGTLPADRSTAVPLPPQLAGLGAAAEVRLTSGADGRTASISARLPERRLEQVVQYRLAGDVWRPVAAKLSR
jgi:hypothetical protein